MSKYKSEKKFNISNQDLIFGISSALEYIDLDAYQE